jgi:hypothetical protein
MYPSFTTLDEELTAVCYAMHAPKVIVTDLTRDGVRVNLL